MRRILASSAVLVLALSAFAVAPAGASGVDPSGWHYNAATRHTYGLTGAMTWLDAEQLAVRLGGHLVTVNDRAEQDWLTGTFPGEWLWIGLNDRAHEGKWVWSSGTRVTFTAWEENEPDNWKGYDPLGEDAAVLNGATPGWDSISDRWLLGGIVEVPGKPKSLAGDTPVVGSHDGIDSPVAHADDCRADGWAYDADSPKRDVTVRILAMRTDFTLVPIEVWRGPASEFREDLVPAGIGDGTSSFSVDLRPLIAYGVPYEITTQGRDVQTGEWFSLDWSPRQLTCFPL